MDTLIQHINTFAAQRDSMQAAYDQRISEGADPKSDEMRQLAQRIQGLDDGIVRDGSNLEFTEATPRKTIDEKAAELAAQRKEDALVRAKVRDILKDDPEFPDEELPVAGVAQAPEGEKQTELEAKSVTPSRG
jgi:hypothetical protein